MRDPAKIFRALADPTRREILRILKPGALAAGEIAAQFEMSGPSISRHLAILSGAGLVAAERDGNRLLYSLESQPLAETLGDFLSAVCPTQRLRRRSSTKRGKAR